MQILGLRIEPKRFTFAETKAAIVPTLYKTFCTCRWLPAKL